MCTKIVQSYEKSSEKPNKFGFFRNKVTSAEPTPKKKWNFGAMRTGLLLYFVKKILTPRKNSVLIVPNSQLFLTFAPNLHNDHKMKTRILLLMTLCMLAIGTQAKKYPQIKFEKTVVDFGTFSMDEPVQKCVFKFTNVGDAKLVINAVHASCGCTVPDYPKDFIAPGGTGEITVTYNGSGKMPGRFKKHIQIFSNCKDDMTRIFIQGEMTDVPVSKKTKK